MTSAMLLEVRSETRSMMLQRMNAGADEEIEDVTADLRVVMRVVVVVVEKEEERGGGR